MNCIKVKINHIKQPLSIVITRNDFINIETTRLSEQLNINANRVDNILNVYCYKICNIRQSKYLDVVPNIIWLTPDELDTATFDIYSNVFWKID